ncbi:hypothetical protein EYZ11_008841 [Aspergillus tanneri]|nr:hypothetical protein EYZ11_008841 [Aspergillus tanneri]
MGLSLNGDTDTGIDRSTGEPEPGVTVKLSEGNHGELLVKCLLIFSHYLGDPAATANMFDIERYYKTGGYVRRVGAEYVIDGRINTNCE